MDNQDFLNKLKIINDPTRLKIIQLLAKNKTMCACKILEELNITQGTLSHHMKSLVLAGFVGCLRKGKWCHYTLLPMNFKEIISVLNKFNE
ncbi:MAG TPA: metalloregulator ArsR/SmtB family transcription factor [Bacilli bacterium]|nr:metalloregulator ArsR/SmtB family transcription factor [Bacilli bacterium]